MKFLEQVRQMARFKRDGEGRNAGSQPTRLPLPWRAVMPSNTPRTRSVRATE